MVDILISTSLESTLIKHFTILFLSIRIESEMAKLDAILSNNFFNKFY